MGKIWFNHSSFNSSRPRSILPSKLLLSKPPFKQTTTNKKPENNPKEDNDPWIISYIGWNHVFGMAFHHTAWNSLCYFLKLQSMLILNHVLQNLTKANKWKKSFSNISGKSLRIPDIVSYLSIYSWTVSRSNSGQARLHTNLLHWIFRNSHLEGGCGTQLGEPLPSVYQALSSIPSTD